MPLPPAAEQDVIAELIDDQTSMLDHLNDDVDKKAETSVALRQSILRHAFTGQLVPQDANDEPASELLRRIAEERAANATKKASPRKPATKRKKRAK